MPVLLVVALVVVPLVELAVIIQVGQRIGAGWTILLVVAASVFGAFLLRREGRRAWAEFQAALAERRWPGDEVTQGALVIVGGALLLTPGFLTDGVGFLLLFAPTRAAVSALIRARVTAGLGGTTWRATGARRRRRDDDGLGIEVVEVRREDPDELPRSSEDRPDEPGGGPDDEGPAGR